MRQRLALFALCTGWAACSSGTGKRVAAPPVEPADTGDTAGDSGDTAEPPDDGLAEVEEGEWLPGGAATNTLMLGGNAFLRPAENLSPENESLFYSGNSWFNSEFVAAPATTDTRDGLGPLQNARSCSGCHFRDGRAKPPESPDDDPLGTLVRLSIPGTDSHGGPVAEPVYGLQLQDGGVRDIPLEGTISMTWEEVAGTYDDGTPYSLRRPILELANLGYGAMHPDTMISFRVAPHMVGLGLLEAISEDRLNRLSDPADVNNDGISGRKNVVWDVEAGTMATGRFGWKSEHPTVRTQTAGAFNGDLGITTSLLPKDDCTDSQEECLEAMSGGDPEFDDHLFDRVSLYSAAIAVPVRRVWDTEVILRGKWLFADAGCVGCHTPSHTTGPGATIPEFDGLLIWPYTDLLLHDMGPELADNRPAYAASGTEWRTPPLWGLGLVPDVNGHNNLLHDGRARGFAEAILWHGGEGERSRDAFVAMSAADRDAIVQFLESL